MISRTSFCVVLLMFLVIPTAGAQEAREPAKPEVKKSQEVKPIDKSLKKKLQEAAQHREPAKPQARLQKQSLQPHKNPDGTVHIEGADKKASTKYVEKNEDESSDEHHHHSDVGCDKFKDLAAKKKCEDEKARPHSPIKK